MIKIFLTLLLLSYFHALEELEIEGRTKHGWARCLPTKRVSNKFIRFILGKELTMYHAYMLTMFGIIFHSLFLFIPWTLAKESKTIGFLLIYFVMEDLWWFLLNPCYGLKNFKKGAISWHKRFWGGLPVSYWCGIILGLALLLIGGIYA
jgi:hypothetical protein